MRRVVRLPGSATYEPALSVVPRPGEALEALLERRQPFQVTASSRAVDDVRASAYAAVDGDPGTTWTAAVGDLRPSLDLRWLGRRSVRGLALSVDRDSAARRPDRVVLRWPGGRRTVRLDAQGRARFAPIRTDRLTLRVDTAEEVSSLGFDRVVAPVGVGVSEVRLRGVPYFPAGLPSTPVRYPCGTGPDVSVDGQRRPTSVTALPADLVAMRPVTAQVCGKPTVSLDEGENAVDVASSAAFAPASLVLRRPGEGGLLVSHAGTSEVPLTETSPEHRTVRVPAGDRLLGVRENVNPGWRAELSGRPLRPVTVDGWQQGFELPGRAGTVRESYAPDGTYRLGLGVGLVLLVVLAALGAVPGRRWPGSGLPPLRAREIRPGVMLGVGILGAGLLAGWSGVLVALPAAALALLLRRFVPEASWWVLGGACLVASLAYVLRPWGSPSGWAGNLAWPSYLVLVSVVGSSGAVAGVVTPTAAGPQTHRGPLDQPVDHLRRRDAQHHREQPDLPAVPLEQAVAGQPHHQVEERQVQAEDAVGDLPQVPQRPPRERRVEQSAGAEDAGQHQEQADRGVQQVLGQRLRG